jgi:alpha-galactosidase
MKMKAHTFFVAMLTGCTAAAGVAVASPPALYGAQAAAAAPNDAGLTGTWIAHWMGPYGDTELVFRLKSVNGKITGSEGLPFGDPPIIDGQLTGNEFHFTVAIDRYGSIQNREATGKIVGDTLEINPAMPLPPPPPPGGPPPGTPSPMQGAQKGPVIAHRGTPFPSYRAAPVDYASLPKVEVPAIHQIPANGLAKTPPMGWNSWNKFRTKIDDKTVREMADAMVSTGMKDAGYVYINIDDGWEDKRDDNGILHPNPNFPDMKALVDYVHSKGLKLGIYSSPGPLTCAGFTGSYGHETEDAKMYASWGIDYLKYDWCSASRVWKDPDMHAVYQRMGDALKATGAPIVYSLCQYGRSEVQTWGTQVGANLWRTTGDIRDRYDSMDKIGFAQTELAKYAGPGHWNDPDMLEIGNGGMTTEEYRMHFSLWSMIASPLIAGNDIRTMTPEIRDILLNKEVIAIDQDALGAGGTQLSATGDLVVWTKPLANGDYAVAFFNRGNTAGEAHIDWSQITWKGKHNVRDLWAHADRGATADGYEATVAPHSVVMLRVSK